MQQTVFAPSARRLCTQHTALIDPLKASSQIVSSWSDLAVMMHHSAMALRVMPGNASHQYKYCVTALRVMHHSINGDA